MVRIQVSQKIMQFFYNNVRNRVFAKNSFNILPKTDLYLTCFKQKVQCVGSQQHSSNIAAAAAGCVLRFFILTTVEGQDPNSSHGIPFSRRALSSEGVKPPAPPQRHLLSFSVVWEPTFMAPLRDSRGTKKALPMSP